MRTLVDVFQSFRKYDKVAFIHRTGIRRFCYSYSDLCLLSLKMASWLESMGAKKGDRALLWAPNSPWWAVVYWGCVVRGIIVVPVDFASGRERVESIARDAQVKIIFQSAYKVDRIENTNAIFVEDVESIIAGEHTCRIDSKISENDIVELVYTSGTTGDPKGVILTHKNLVTNLKQIRNRISIDERYTLLSLLPLSHMIEQTAGFLTPLFCGAAVVYMATLKPSAIMDAFREEDIYASIIVPRLLQALQTGVERELFAKHLLPLFRTLSVAAKKWSMESRAKLFFIVRRKFGSHFQFFVSGGSSLYPETARFWQGIGIPVYEGYGLTECSPVLTANPPGKEKIGSVGTPLRGVILRLCGQEIIAKGDNIFSGYWNNEKATREAFTHDEWYKTGDLGEFDSDGYLYIKGRKKEMIVTGAGVNVYPSDIEDALNALMGVKESCIIGKETPTGEEVHAVLIPDGSRDPKDIIAEANGRLDASGQITSFSVWPDLEFPKTTTLKIQKFRVKERLKSDMLVTSGAGGDTLSTLIAQVTRRSIAEVKDDAVLVRDLGLTSIARLELVTYIEQQFHLDLEDTAVDQYMTVGKLRSIISRREKTKKKHFLRFWTNSAILRIVRDIHHMFFMLFNAIFLPIKSAGRENIAFLEGQPALFIANHVSYLDHHAIMSALPRSIRRNTATAAWQEFFFFDGGSFLKKIWKRFCFEYSTIFMNIFPLPKESGFRNNLIFMGKLIDRGTNILVFPEGARSPDGDMRAFMNGLGMMVKELRVPVVPIKIAGIEHVYPVGAIFPRRGKVGVTFGKPIYFGGKSTDEILTLSRNEILALPDARKS